MQQTQVRVLNHFSNANMFSVNFESNGKLLLYFGGLKKFRTVVWVAYRCKDLLTILCQMLCTEEQWLSYFVVFSLIALSMYNLSMVK